MRDVSAVWCEIFDALLRERYCRMAAGVEELVQAERRERAAYVDDSCAITRDIPHLFTMDQMRTLPRPLPQKDTTMKLVIQSDIFDPETAKKKLAELDTIERLVAQAALLREATDWTRESGAHQLLLDLAEHARSLNMGLLDRMTFDMDAYDSFQWNWSPASDRVALVTGIQVSSEDALASSGRLKVLKISVACAHRMVFGEHGMQPVEHLPELTPFVVPRRQLLGLTLARRSGHLPGKFHVDLLGSYLGDGDGDDCDVCHRPTRICSAHANRSRLLEQEEKLHRIHRAGIAFYNAHTKCEVCHELATTACEWLCDHTPSRSEIRYSCDAHVEDVKRVVQQRPAGKVRVSALSKRVHVDREMLLELMQSIQSIYEEKKP
jgi:hypothetical protein